MRDPMFRRTALQHLASPDRLDEAIQVTNPRGWLALAAVTVVLLAAVIWGTVARVPTIVRGNGYLLRAGGVQTVEAPLAGRVLALLVRPGAYITEGQPVASIGRADGEPVEVTASVSGRVLDLRAAAGHEVERGDALVSVEQTDQPLEARVFLAPDRAARVSPGMPVQLALAAGQRGEAGVLLGEIASVSAYPATIAGVSRLLANEDLARALFAGGPPVEVRVTLQPGNLPDTYRWRGAAPPPERLAQVQGGTPLSAEIIAGEQPPLMLLLGRAER